MCSTAAVQAALKAFGGAVDWRNDPYDDAARRVYDLLLALAEDIAKGRVLPQQVESRLMDILESGHVASHYGGQEMSGFTPSRILAQQRGRAVALGQNSYVRGLVTALLAKDSRYWSEEAGDWRQEPLQSRLGSYVGRTRGTAYDGWTSAAPPYMLYEWRLGGVEEHCEDCPTLSETGPWLSTEDTSQLQYPVLFTTPGECDTPCLFNCACHLERVADGATGPMPFRFK